MRCRDAAWGLRLGSAQRCRVGTWCRRAARGSGRRAVTGRARWERADASAKAEASWRCEGAARLPRLADHDADAQQSVREVSELLPVAGLLARELTGHEVQRAVAHVLPGAGSEPHQHAGDGCGIDGVSRPDLVAVADLVRPGTGLVHAVVHVSGSDVGDADAEPVHGTERDDLVA